MYQSAAEARRPSIQSEREMLDLYMPLNQSDSYVCEDCNSCGSGDCNSCCSTTDD